jgi:uncharacterized membrane protein YraQ (UPF0718 family)
MAEFIFSTGISVLINTLQLILGCILSILLFYFTNNKIQISGSKLSQDIIIIVLFSFIGIILPLGTFGVIPIIIVLLIVKFKSHAVFSLLVSNIIFNMIVPFIDPGFIWKTGFLQVVLAFTAGVTIGLLLRLLKTNENIIFKIHDIGFDEKNPFSISIVKNILNKTIIKVVPFIIVGVIINLLFQKYIFSGFFNEIFSNSKTSFIPVFLAKHDVASPTFLLAMTLFTTLMDLTKVSALLFLLKIKGLGVFFGFCLFLIIMLAVPAFIK